MDSTLRRVPANEITPKCVYKFSNFKMTVLPSLCWWFYPFCSVKQQNKRLFMLYVQICIHSSVLKYWFSHNVLFEFSMNLLKKKEKVKRVLNLFRNPEPLWEIILQYEECYWSLISERITNFFGRKTGISANLLKMLDHQGEKISLKM